jgi:hypothetical protein
LNPAGIEALATSVRRPFAGGIGFLDREPDGIQHGQAGGTAGTGAGKRRGDPGD